MPVHTDAPPLTHTYKYGKIKQRNKETQGQYLAIFTNDLFVDLSQSTVLPSPRLYHQCRLPWARSLLMCRTYLYGRCSLYFTRLLFWSYLKLYCTHRTEFIINRNLFLQIVLYFKMSKINYPGSHSCSLNQHQQLSCAESDFLLAARGPTLCWPWCLQRPHRLRSCTTLAEVQSLALSTHTRWFTTTCTGGSQMTFDLLKGMANVVM